MVDICCKNRAAGLAGRRAGPPYSDLLLAQAQAEYSLGSVLIPPETHDRSSSAKQHLVVVHCRTAKAMPPRAFHLLRRPARWCHRSEDEEDVPAGPGTRGADGR